MYIARSLQHPEKNSVIVANCNSQSNRDEINLQIFLIQSLHSNGFA